MFHRRQIGVLTAVVLGCFFFFDHPAQATVCDVDEDGYIDIQDIYPIVYARNTPSSGPDDPRDSDGDGIITGLDARTCVVQCTLPRCKTIDPDAHINVVESDNQHLKTMVAFGNPIMAPVEANGEQFTQVIMPGIDPIGEPGLPAIPVLRRLVAVPWGAEVSATAAPNVREIVHDVNLYPFQGQARDQLGPPPPEYFSDPPFTKNDEVYASDTLIPESIVTVTPVGQYRDLRMVQVEVATGQYNPAEQALTLYEAVEVEVAFTGGSGVFITTASENPFENAPRSVFAESVLNSEAVSRFVGPALVHVRPGFCRGEELLILTHPDFRAAADDLAEHRRNSGTSTTVIEVNDGDGPGPDTNEEIDDLIETRYEDCTVRPSYVLLIGDTEFIPTFYVSTTFAPNTASDYHYALLNRCVECHEATVPPPDFALGRISADSQSEAQAVVDKIIGYEANPPTQDAFYLNSSIASQFQCCRTSTAIQDGVDQRGFIETSELVRDEMLNQGLTVERIYTETIDANYAAQVPARDTTPRRYFNGTLLPAPIGAGSGFGWAGDTQDIVDAFNDGRFLIFHRDHGWSGGWVHPSLTTADVLGDLTNGDLLPVVFSVNCSSARFDDNESVAEELLRLANGGTVGLIGDTRDSGTWVNNALSRGLFDAVWPDTVVGFGGSDSIRRLGDILNHAKLYVLNQVGVTQTAGSVSESMAEDELYLYHVLGDPVLSMWTSRPFTLSREFSLVRFAEYLQVFYAEEEAVITAMQGGAPIGRGTVSEGEARLEYVIEPEPGEAIELVATKPNFVSVRLGGCYPDLPSPNLIATGTEDYTGSDGQEYTRYMLAVTNSHEFPAELFAPSPDLPPCGANPDASRSWVSIYDDTNRRLYGFCGLESADGLNELWFSLLKGVPPPDSVYIEIHDRRCDITYTSNLAGIYF